MKTSDTYVVSTIKPWNIEAFQRRTHDLEGNWIIISDPDELSAERLFSLAPRYIFFPHWSWHVPENILSNFECVCFHMTDVPYGRGGSPLQNLIVRGHKKTKVTALRMVEDFDAGPVYLKSSLNLDGSAQEIFERFADLAFDMMNEIVLAQPEPVVQSGEATEFKRRTPAQSQMPDTGEIASIYDHIRMLDADTYPHAFLDHGDLRLSFHQAVLQGDVVRATVSITSRPESDDEDK